MTDRNASATLHPGPNPLPHHAFDLATIGYREDEYLVRGEATSYLQVGDRGADGHWSADPADRAPFVTRVLTRRPIDPARFSGTVVVEWLNVSGGVDAGPDWSYAHNHLVRRGHGWVGVSAQKAGIDGGGLVEGLPLKKLAPDRYGVLDHPGDAWSFDVFTQIGRLLRAPAGTPLLGPLAPARLLAVGESQSAMHLATYVNAVDAHTRVYDGFLLHGRPATAARLDGVHPRRGRPLAESTDAVASHGERVRSDARVPVLIVQSETDLVVLGAARAAQPDRERVRTWEVAGSAHADTYLLVASAHDDGRVPPTRLAQMLAPTSEPLGLTTGAPVNSGPQTHYVVQAAIEHLDRWAGGGSPPPPAPRLDLTDDSRDFRRDTHGNATGGLRTPWVDVPVATLSGLGQTGPDFAMLFGTTVPFEPETLARLYPGGQPDYLARFARALDVAIRAGFVLAEDRPEILALAAAAWSSEG